MQTNYSALNITQNFFYKYPKGNNFFCCLHDEGEGEGNSERVGFGINTQSRDLNFPVSVYFITWEILKSDSWPVLLLIQFNFGSDQQICIQNPALSNSVNPKA